MLAILRSTALALLLAAGFAGASFTAARAADAIVVFAAASLKDALDDAVALYAGERGREVSVSYAGTSILARQIEQAAPADVFFSADVAWMDYLEERDLIRPGSRQALLANRLVLIAPANSDAMIEIANGLDLAAVLGRRGYLTMADTGAVPAGRYGKAALQELGAWEAVAERIVQADNVRTALAFVARGEAPLGIVYATDAAAEPSVRVVGVFPENTHPPIRYLVALTATSVNPAASGLLDFLRSEAAAEVFRRHGFTVLQPGS